MTPFPTCLLVDEDPATLVPVERALGVEGIDVLGVAGTGVEALLLLDRCPVKVIVVPFELADLGGAAFAWRAAELARSKTRVVFSTKSTDSRLVCAALDAGAHGVVLDDKLPSSFLPAITEAAAGRLYVDPRLRR